ncbi:serine hydrolase, partial [Peptostreptococcus porci]|uniref:serine hydrolase n=1 Tax=Peptostreptococcus porci TaxID=2652282 RepID=UPI002A915DD7
MNQNRIIFFRKMVIASVISLMLACQFAMASYAEATRYNDSFSRSAIISDIDTGRIIYEKNADNVQSMASISKVMTLLIAFDAIDSKKASEDDVVTIVQSDVNRYGTHMELVAGDKVTLRELMEGM